MTELLSLSVAMFAGLLMTRPLSRFHLPDVTAYLIAGVLIGPCCLGLLHIPGQLGKSDKGVITSGDLRAVGCGRGSKAETGSGTRAPSPADGSESLPGLLFHVQRVQERTQCAHMLSCFSHV